SRSSLARAARQGRQAWRDLGMEPVTAAQVALDGVDAGHRGERLELMRRGLTNYLGTLVPCLIGLAIVPVMLHSLNAAAYDIWIAALSLRVLIGGCDLGLGWGIRRGVAEDARY